MKKRLFTLFIILNFSLFSQTTDSIYNNIFSNVSQYRDYSEVYLGNYGLAKFNLLSPFKDNESNLKQLFSSNSQSKLYTDIFFVTGSGKENYLSLNYNQMLSKNLKMNLLLIKSASIGIYQMQETSLSNYDFGLKYLPKDKLYNFKFNASYYRRYNELNGGINDSTFRDRLESNITLKSLFPIQFQSNNFLVNKMINKNMRYSFSHSYKLSKNANDSLGYFSLNQSLGYGKQTFNFETENPVFFDTIFYDTIRTNDSLIQREFSHLLSLSYNKNKARIEAGIFIEYVEYESYSPFFAHFENTIFGTYQNQFGNFNLKSELGFTFEKSIFETYYFRNKGSYLNSKNKIFQEIKAEINSYSEEYKFYYNKYKSNHYEWNDSRKINDILAVKFGVISKKLKFKVGANFEIQNNSIVFDVNSNITQTNISLFSFYLNKEFKITNWLFWNTNLHFQNVISSQQVEIPNFVTSNRIYFKGKILKDKVLKFKIGLDILYYTGFYAKAYNPALDKFYLQNHTKIGNYPYVDFFAEFYLKTNFAFFMSISHLNSGLTGLNYFATVNYPSQDRAFKFGLKWRLFE